MKKFLIGVAFVALSASLSWAEGDDIKGTLDILGSEFNAYVIASLAESHLEGGNAPKIHVEALKWWLISQAAAQHPIGKITPETTFGCGWHLVDIGRRMAALKARMPEADVAEAHRHAQVWMGINVR